MMEVDRNGLQVLDQDECRQLLGSATLGRVAVSDGALPTVLPVNFHVVDNRILIRTGRGSKLDAATRNAVVAFEVDDIDPLWHAGWSVVVIGVASELTDPGSVPRSELLRVPRWAPRGDARIIAISMEIVTGRRIVAGTATTTPGVM